MRAVFSVCSAVVVVLRGRPQRAPSSSGCPRVQPQDSTESVPRRRRHRLAQRHGRRRPEPLRHRSERAGLLGVRGRRPAGADVLQSDEPADCAVAADRHERQHGEPDADRAGSGRRLRAQAAPAGLRAGRRLRQPRRDRAGLHQQASPTSNAPFARRAPAARPRSTTRSTSR